MPLTASWLTVYEGVEVALVGVVGRGQVGQGRHPPGEGLDVPLPRLHDGVDARLVILFNLLLQVDVATVKASNFIKWNLC